MPAIEVVGFLNDLFSRFDSLLDKYGLNKIKTIGDAYMVVSCVERCRPRRSGRHSNTHCSFLSALS